MGFYDIELKSTGISISEANVHEIFADDADALSGIASLISTKVRIDKVVAV